jgi:hypothetical protein
LPGVALKLVRTGANGRLQDDPAARYISYRPLEQSPKSLNSHALFHKWVQECDSSHAECVKRDNVVLPTRLIDVGLGEDSRDPRLCTPSSGSKGKYAALSYCWGTSQNLTLTSDNLADLLKCIPLEDLPQTLRDAVSIARELGIPHLWIDSLCIIQDSREDWQNESAKMSSVYSNAFLTIQATGADDTTKGCFLPRTSAHPCDGFTYSNRPITPLQPPVSFPFLEENGIMGTVYIRFGATPDEKIQAPVSMRGWIYQESLLSSRLMCFGAYKLFWECATAYHDESGATSFNYGFFPGFLKPLRPAAQMFLVDSEDCLSPEQKVWAIIATDYCRLRLKDPRDKLPALAGIARQISLTRPGDKYCAGMWKNDMPATLMWDIQLESNESGGLIGGPLREYRAPSWSWAAWDGSLQVYSSGAIDTDGVCEVVDVSITLAYHDPFGEVLAGELQIHGLLIQGWRFYNGKAHPRILPKIDSLPDDDKILDVSKGWIREDFRNPDEPKKVPYMAWFLRVQPKGGLVLELLEDGTYRRIGVFFITIEDWFCAEDLQTITIV